MPPRRPAPGGAFGGGTQPMGGRTVDYSSLVDAVLGGTANLLQVTTARKLAERAAKAKEAADMQARNDKLAQQAADEAYRRDESARRAQEFATTQATQHDDRWNTNARLNAQDEYQRTRDAKTDADKAKIPLAPVRGTPEYLTMLEDEERLKQRFAPAKEPKAPTLQFDNNGQPWEYKNGRLIRVPMVMDPIGPPQPVAQPQAAAPPSGTQFPAGVNPLTGQVNTPRMGAAPAPAGIAAPVAQPSTAPATTAAPRFGRMGAQPSVRATLPTEGERKAAALYASGSQGYTTLESLLDKQTGAPSIISQQSARLPFGMGNELAGTSYRQMTQAANMLADSWLRLTSGAAVPETEVHRFAQSFTPLAGDDKTTLKQKKEARATIIKALKAAAGRALPNDAEEPPPQDYDHIASQFDRR